MGLRIDISATEGTTDVVIGTPAETFVPAIKSESEEDILVIGGEIDDDIDPDGDVVVEEFFLDDDEIEIENEEEIPCSANLVDDIVKVYDCVCDELNGRELIKIAGLSIGPPIDNAAAAS